MTKHDNDFLTRRKKLAEQLLQCLVEFAEFEKWQVPYEFIATMEGLAVVTKKPDWFLFHDENGQGQPAEEPAEQQKKPSAVRAIAAKPHNPSKKVGDIVIRYCSYCENVIRSSEATLCLRCGEKLPLHVHP